MIMIACRFRVCVDAMILTDEGRVMDGHEQRQSLTFSTTSSSAMCVGEEFPSQECMEMHGMYVCLCV